MRPSARAAAIARLTLTRKAYDVIVLDLRGLTTMADFFVVCSADSESQIKAIAEAVEEGMEQRSESPWHREAGSPNWVLLDYVDVVLHIFHKAARSFYSLEKLWGDAVITAVADDEAELDLEGKARKVLEAVVPVRPEKRLKVQAAQRVHKAQRAQKRKPTAKKGLKAGAFDGAPGGRGKIGKQRVSGGKSSLKRSRTNASAPRPSKPASRKKP